MNETVDPSDTLVSVMLPSYPVTASEKKTWRLEPTATLVAPSTGVELTTVGVLNGVTVLDGAEYGLGPTRFTARTTNRYPVPLVSPSTTRLVAPGPAERGVPTGAPPGVWTWIS